MDGLSVMTSQFDPLEEGQIDQSNDWPEGVSLLTYTPIPGAGQIRHDQ